MKTSATFVLLILSMLEVHAQDYLISFSGAGDTTAVSTIRVDNLTSGAAVTLNGGDVLHLIAATGTGELNVNHKPVQIYPNPMADQTILSFVAPESGNAVIAIIDLSGKTISQIHNFLPAGEHRFRISGIRQGLFFVEIAGKNYHYSEKLLSQNNLHSKVGIEPVSTDRNTSRSQSKSGKSTIDMTFKKGDILMYKGSSGTYSTLVVDIPTGNKTTIFNFVACLDSNGNHYTTVQIGTQTWMAENLKATSLNNESPMSLVTDNTEWSTITTPAYCWYQNDSETYKSRYGPLYNWYAVNTGRLAPVGWHVPTDEEWTILMNYLGGLTIGGGKLKETGTAHWLSPNGEATNISGFSALPNGYRNFIDGSYDYVGRGGGWWSSTILGGIGAWHYSLGFNDGSAYRRTINPSTGSSVRCLRD